MLHITNGDSVGTALIQSPLPGDVIAWRDVLHEGPVPEGLSLHALSRVRAHFIFDCGWTDSLETTLEGFAARDAALAEALVQDEVVLWFEHDLYDQLQLLQLLDWFAAQPRERTRLTLISRHEYLGTLGPRALAAHFPDRELVTPAQLTLARMAWHAFRAPDPTAIVALLEHDLTALPFLGAALRRHLEQFPGRRDGLSRSERQAMRACEHGPTTAAAAFLISQEQDEPAAFLGDTTFAWYLGRLAAGAMPLVRFADGAPLTLPTSQAEADRFWQREVELTAPGRAVLEGRADRVAMTGLDRWLGGVHLETPGSIWRWDPDTARVQRSPQ